MAATIASVSRINYAIDDEEHRDQERQPEVHISKDGPYYVRGGVELQDVEWGAVITFAAIQLIRESKLLITVVLDDAERESTSQ